MKQLSTSQRVQVVSALVEGNSIASIVRMTGISKTTILKLIVDLGTACQNFHDATVKNLNTKRVECDEIWAFCHSKAKNVPADHQGKLGYGDVWTFTAIDADSKLMITWLCGRRSSEHACDFMLDLAARVTDRIQLTTDGLNKYPAAVLDAFQGNVDYAQLIKIYGNESGTAGRYSPPKLTAIEHEMVCGAPDMSRISTSYVERSNLTCRMQMRRYTRLTNGFSKKFENHKHMTALFFVSYNFCRMHMSLKKTPAMAAGLADHKWTLEELVSLLATWSNV